MLQILKKTRKGGGKIIKWYNSLTTEIFIFASLTIFYFSIWIINPSNYIVLVSFIILGSVIYYKTNNFHLSLLVVFLASAIIFTGKSYTIQLIPPGIFDPLTYPNGYVIQFTITANLILGLAMILTIIGDVVKKNVPLVKLVNNLNLILIAIIAWYFISDLFGSERPEISIIFELLSLPSFILYFYLQSYSNNIKAILPILLSIFAAFVIFESTISFQQYLAKSPVGKTIEIQKNIEHTGSVADELLLEYTYRPDGTFNNTNTLAMNLAFWLTFIFSFYIKFKSKKLLFALALGFVSLVLTLSRSAWAGFGIGLLTIFFVIEKVKKIKIVTKFNKLLFPVILILIPLFVFVVLPRIEKSIYLFNDGGGTLRLEQIQATWQLILGHPIFGVGNGMLVVEGFNYIPQSIFGIAPLDIHNWYLWIIANHGIPAFIFFTTFVLLSTKQIFYRILKAKEMRFENFISVWFVSALAIFLTIGLFFAENGSFWIVGLLGCLNNKRA